MRSVFVAVINVYMRNKRIDSYFQKRLNWNGKFVNIGIIGKLRL